MNDKIIAASDKHMTLVQLPVNKQVSLSETVSHPVPIQQEDTKKRPDTIEKNAGQQIINDKVAQLNKQMQSLRRDIQFTVDEESGESVIKVVDSETQEVIRQIPSEEMLKIRESLDNFRGLLFKSKV